MEKMHEREQSGTDQGDINLGDIDFGDIDRTDTEDRIAEIRNRYVDKINLALARGEDARAMELSAEFRDEAFVSLFGSRVPKNVA